MSSTGAGTGPGRGGRTAAAAVAVALGLVACSEPVATEVPGLTAEDLQEVRDEVADLDDRVATLEDRLVESTPPEPVEEPEEPAAEDTFFGDPGSAVGQQVMVRGEVAELLTSSPVASAFRIAGDVGEPVAVVSVTPPPEIATGDVVEVSGTPVEVDPGTFEREFGIAADELFDDAGAWFADAEGRVAIAAVRIEVLQAAAGN